MAKLLYIPLIATSIIFMVGCSNAPKTPQPPKKNNLSAQPHNRPASWEGSGGALGAALGGSQYQD